MSADITIYKGAARPSIRLKVVDDAGAARDITGWSLSWRLGKLNVPGQSNLIERTTPSGVTITDGPGGVCEVALSSAALAMIPAGPYTHELRRTDSGQEEVLGQGAALVRASLSQ